MSKRVTLIGHYPPPYGGVPTLMAQMEDALAAAGWHVAIFNLGHGDPDRSNVTNFGGSWNRVLEVFRLWGAFARSGSDIHHYVSASYRSFWMGSVCLVLARLTGRRIVVSLVGGAFPDFVAGLRPPGRWFARAALGFARALLPCSDAIRVALESLCLDVPMVQLTNNFQTEGGVKGELPSDVLSFIEAHSPVVSSTGAAAAEYGLLEAVRGLAILRPSHPDLGYVLVMTRFGNEEYEERFRAALEERDLARSTLIVRSVPDFIALLNASDVFLRSALVDGDSMSVREALSVGIPAVASDAGFRPDGVMLYKRDSAEEMAARLEEAFSTPRRDPAEMRAEARHNLETLLEVYQRVTGGSQRPHDRSS
jgi:glycogen(starch) synthase